MFGFKVFVIATFCVAGSLQTPFQRCSDDLPAPESLRVRGCEKLPCNFVKGAHVEAEWDFFVAADTDNLRPVVVARALGINVKYPLPEQDACKSLTNGECPLDEGELVTYGLDMPVLEDYPKIGLHLTFSIVDKDKHVHSCFKIDAKVVDA